MKKKSVFLFILLSLLLGVTACGRQTPPSENPEPARQTVELTVWGAEEDTALLEEMIASFQARYANEADFLITCQPQSESSCKDALLVDLEGGADVFTFADDQVAALAAAGALDPIADAAVIQGANLSAAVEAASVNGMLYAYPLTADNGYFLYYNKAYFSEEDVQTMDRLLAVAAEAKGLVTMDWTSAWYVYAFFGNTGLQVGLNDDGLTNYCTWNSTDGSVTGVDVARAMLDIAASPASRTAPSLPVSAASGTRRPSRKPGVNMPERSSSPPTPAAASRYRWPPSPAASWSESMPTPGIRNGPRGWRNGSLTRKTSACALLSGGRDLQTARLRPPRRYSSRRPLRRCWPSRSFPRSNGSVETFGIRSQNSRPAWPREIPPARPSRFSWTAWWWA